MSLTSADLAGMRSTIANLMPDTGHILSVTETPDGQGGVKQTWGTATASVSCRVDSVKAQESTTGGAVRPYHSYVITLPYNTTVTQENCVKVGSDIFNVTSVDDPKSWDITRRIYAELV